MHYNAKRRIAIAWRPSVCLSLTLLDQDHLDWKSWKLNARTISPNLRSSQPKGHPPTPTETWGNLGTLEVVGGKSGVLEHKSGNISETRKDRGKVTMEGQANSATLFRTVPLLTPYGLRFANFWGSPPHPKLESLLSHDGWSYGLQIWPLHLQGPSEQKTG